MLSFRWKLCGTRVCAWGTRQCYCNCRLKNGEDGVNGSCFSCIAMVTSQKQTLARNFSLKSRLLSPVHQPKHKHRHEHGPGKGDATPPASIARTTCHPRWACASVGSEVCQLSLGVSIKKRWAQLLIMQKLEGAQHYLRRLIYPVAKHWGEYDN